MNEFLAQASTMSNQELIGYGAGGGIGLLILGWVKDLGKEWLMNRTKMGKNIKNGSGCKVTPEALDVILRNNPKQHEEIIAAIEKRDHLLEKISDSQIKIATILERIDR